MTADPRVLVLPSSYFARGRMIGGGERYATEYARALARRTPTTLALFDPVPARERDGDLEVRTFGISEPRGRIWFPATRESRRELASFDVVHLMIFPSPAADLLLLLARLRGLTVVLTDVGGGVPSPSTYLQRLHPRLNLMRLADGLALLSEHSAGQFAGWRQPRVLLYGGSDLPPLVESASAGEYALFVGRILPHKGILELIEALGPEMPLHVVGRPYDPEYLAVLQRAAEGKRVRFFLDADDAELRRQYRGARVVLQPSVPVRSGAYDTAELLGLVTLEGMAHAKPVIVTRTASLPELVTDGETGYVVPPRDPAALRDRVGRLLEDAELATRLGDAARRRVERNFSWDGVAERGLSFYRSLGERRGGSKTAAGTGAHGKEKSLAG